MRLETYMRQLEEDEAVYEWGLKQAIGNIGYPPYYKIKNEYYDKETAKEVLYDLYEENYLLYEYEVEENEVVEKYL